MVRLLIACASAFVLAAEAKASESSTALAYKDYFEGRPVVATAKLEQLYFHAEGRKAGERLTALTNLLDLCIHTTDGRCLAKYVQDYTALLPEFGSTTPEFKHVLASKARIYMGYAALHSADQATIRNQVLRHIVDRPGEISFGDSTVYMRQRF